MNGDFFTSQAEELGEDGRSVLVNRKNGLRVTLRKEAGNGPLIALKSHGRELSWGFAGEVNPVACAVKSGETLLTERLKSEFYEEHGPEAAFVDTRTAEEKRSDMTARMSEATYEEILPGVTARYTLRSDTVKEDIIIRNREALSHVKIMLSGGYRYESDEQGRITAYDSGYAPVYVFGRPVVYDAAGATTVAGVELMETANGTALQYTLNEEYLSAAEYPVTIDPLIWKDLAPIEVLCMSMRVNKDTYAKSSEETLKIGRDGKKKNAPEYAIAVKFNTLAGITSGDTVTSAQLMMRSGVPKYIGKQIIQAQEIKTPWDEDSKWSTFKGEGKLGPIVDYAYGKGEPVYGKKKEKSFFRFDITSLYRKWYRENNEGGSENQGVLLRLYKQKSNIVFPLYNAHEKHAGAKRPHMIVNYVSHAGVKGWWTYEQLNADRAGTAHVDIFNGNLVYAHTDTEMNGSRMPVSASHWYNSCRSGEHVLDAKCGRGWKLNLQQYITKKKIGGVKYRVLTDGEGTEIHFVQAKGKSWKDIEGQGLELTDKENIEITDKSGTKMVFSRLPTAKSKPMEAGVSRESAGYLQTRDERT